METATEGWRDDEWEGLNEEERQWMKKAFELAEEALRCDEVPVGCVFVLDGEEVGRGRNEVNATRDPTRHAEMCALERMEKNIEDLRSKLEGITLYVSLEPCIMCASALYRLGVKRIVYGAANERFGGVQSVGSREKYGIEKKIELVEGVQKTKTVALLKTFYDKQNPFAPEEKRKVKKKKLNNDANIDEATNSK